MNYGDIINLPHHVSKNHPQMSMEKRAAQFAPFMALDGYVDEVKETARETEDEMDLDEEQKSIMDVKLQIIREHLEEQPYITFKYFIKDNKKEGGEFKTVSGNVIKIDEYKELILLEDMTQVAIKDIVDISGNIIKLDI